MNNRRSGRWSIKVTEKSNALDLERRVFTRETPRRDCSLSLKRSAEKKQLQDDKFRHFGPRCRCSLLYKPGWKKLACRTAGNTEKDQRKLRNLYAKSPKDLPCPTTGWSSSIFKISSDGSVLSSKGPCFRAGFKRGQKLGLIDRRAVTAARRVWRDAKASGPKRPPYR